ncbi:MAG TPA: VCBS repeat-containing protein, partial [bacterium]|nr:VCBS repeat-containing protein [bacterium]
AMLLASGMLAQEPLWELPGRVYSQASWYNLSTFRDFDGDGVRDMIVRFIVDPMTNYLSSIEVRSGRSGRRLWGISQGSVIDARDAGDCDGDGRPDVLLLYGGSLRWLEVWSTRTGTLLWHTNNNPGSAGYGYGDALLADIDLDGDGLQDVLVATNHASHSTLYAYDHSGALLWLIDHRAQGRFVYSIGHYGDFNHDGYEDFLLGLQGDPNGAGVVAICSGLDGSYLRQSFGMQVGNYMCDHVTNVGDIDGDGVHDYAGFPAWFTFTGDCAIFSGADGSVLRTWLDYAESVVAGADFDLDRDGVPDLLISNEQLVAPNTYGRTRAISGRDGQELWRVDAVPYVPGAPAVYGYYGWGRYAVSLGTWPDRAYPSLAWMELGYRIVGNATGRIRTWGGEHVGQGPIKGHACSSGDVMPLIGARKNANGGARVTLAHAPPAAFAVLVLSLQDSPAGFGVHTLPLDLAPLGMPGCLLQVAPDVVHWRVTGNGPGHDRGYCHADLPFQFTATATGVPVFAQWLAYDPVTLGYAATEVHTLRGQ